MSGEFGRLGPNGLRDTASGGEWRTMTHAAIRAFRDSKKPEGATAFQRRTATELKPLLLELVSELRKRSISTTATYHEGGAEEQPAWLLEIFKTVTSTEEATMLYAYGTLGTCYHKAITQPRSRAAKMWSGKNVSDKIVGYRWERSSGSINLDDGVTYPFGGEGARSALRTFCDRHGITPIT